MNPLPDEFLVNVIRNGGPAEGLAPTGSAIASGIDSYKYVGFEDQFRGSRDEIRMRMSHYLPLFEGAADVLDVGCGRGELLELLAELQRRPAPETMLIATGRIPAAFNS